MSSESSAATTESRRPDEPDDDCCWIGDPCPIHNPEPRAWTDADNPGASYGGQP